MSPKSSPVPQGNNKSHRSYHGSDSAKCNQGASSSATNRPNNGKKKPNQETNRGRRPPTPDTKDRKKKKRKKSKNEERQLVSENMGKGEKDRVNIGKPEVVLAATDEFPYIKFDDKVDALAFAKAADTTNRQLVLFVDGSASKRDIPFHGIPTPPPSPEIASRAASPPPAPLSLGSNGGASVVYYENGKWECAGFSLPYIHGSDEAEMRGLEQGFGIALENAQDNSNSRNKVIIFTDCKWAMKRLAECLKGNDVQSAMPAVAMAASKARELRRLGMDVEVRWIPAHMGQHSPKGNFMADLVAKNANAYTFNLSDARAREIAGRVHRTEDPYSQRPRV